LKFSSEQDSQVEIGCSDRFQLDRKESVIREAEIIVDSETILWRA
jgi:hypothetical protein